MIDHPFLTAAIRNWPITLGAVLYAIELLICLRDRNEPGALMFFGYTIGNVGILWGFYRLMTAAAEK